MRRLLSTAVQRLIVTASVAAVMAAAPVLAQTTTYQYTGNTFNQFSCGPSIDSNGVVTGTLNCSTGAPTNTNTSYTLTDKVTATLVFDAPLPSSMALTSVTGLAGFHVTLNDGHQTVQSPISAGQALVAMVATDSSGNISEWQVFINTGGTLNGGVSTQRFTNTTGTLVQADGGTLACCHPKVPGDLARRFGPAGVWTVSGGTPEPDELVENLIDVVFDPATGLTTGQVNSLADKLTNALASINAGLVKQALNQLNSFISSVQVAVKTGKLSSGTGAALIAEANGIISLLQP